VRSRYGSRNDATAERRFRLLTNAAGERVDTGSLLHPGGAGTYHVNWHVLSLDPHTTNGSYTFQVGQ